MVQNLQRSQQSLRLVFLFFCAIVGGTSAWDVSVHAREMEWSPTRIFQVNARGIREQTGWEGEWECNLCGRTILHDDALAMAASIADAPEASCPVDGPRTLVVDVAHSSTNWICLPGCAQRLPDDDASDAHQTTPRMGSFHLEQRIGSVRNTHVSLTKGIAYSLK